MVFDARIRPPFREFLQLSVFAEEEKHSATGEGVDRWPSSIEERSIEHFVREMDEAGIERGLVVGRQAAPAFGSVPNDRLAELRDAHPGRFWIAGAAGGSTPTAAFDEARRCVEELACDAVVLDPGWLDPPRRADDEFFWPVYAYCQEAEVPVLVTLGVFSGPDLSYAHPIAVQHVSTAFPRLRIVVVHAAWPWIGPMLGVAFRHRNVWLLPDFYMSIPHMPGARDLVDAANSFLGARILHGSAYPGRPLGQALDEVRQLPLIPDVMEKITSSNLLHLLRVDA